MTRKWVYERYLHRQWRYWSVTCDAIAQGGSHKGRKWSNYNDQATNLGYLWVVGEPV